MNYALSCLEPKRSLTDFAERCQFANDMQIDSGPFASRSTVTRGAWAALLSLSGEKRCSPSAPHPLPIAIISPLIMLPFSPCTFFRECVNVSFVELLPAHYLSAII